MDNLFFMEARCANTGKDFFIRFDKAAGNVWCQTYGVKSRPQNSNGSEFKVFKIDISKTAVGPQYKCPYCGNESYVRCGACGKITCSPYNPNLFTCKYCGHSGKVTGEMKITEGKSGIGQG